MFNPETRHQAKYGRKEHLFSLELGGQEYRGWGQGWDLDSWDMVIFLKNPIGVGQVDELLLSGGLLGVRQRFTFWFWSLRALRVINTSKGQLKLYLLHVVMSYKKSQTGLACALGDKKWFFLPEAREAVSVVLTTGGWLCQQGSSSTGRRSSNWGQTRRLEQKNWGCYEHQKPEKNHKKLEESWIDEISVNYSSICIERI